MGFDNLYRKHGKTFSVDWLLLKALAQVESAERPQAQNPSDPSFGIMQVLCTGTKGNDDASCVNRLNVLGWSDATPNRLFDPDYNIFTAAQIIQWNLKTYGFRKGIAVYNNWSARKDPPDGPFRNASYVAKVVSKHTALGGEPSP